MYNIPYTQLNMTITKARATIPLPHWDDFLLSLQTNNYSPETIYNYEWDRQVLAQFLHELKLSFAKLDKRTVDRYKAHLTSIDRRTSSQMIATKRLKSYSINRMLSSLRRYLNYLIEMDLPTPLPPEAVKLGKTQEKHQQHVAVGLFQFQN